ncbi:metal ABC transporter permease, partial [Mesorhizobium sp. M7A.T.Ca.TU.009.01.3.2]
VGTILSYHIDAATGPTIVVVQAGVFLLALFQSKRPKQQVQLGISGE